MAGITKVYPGGVRANDQVALEVMPGTIHAVVGENGAGKSTLMGILYGAVRPDEGRIRLFGEDVHLRSPADAIRLGIGMVTQHSSFIPALTLLDNILLGHETAALGVLRRGAALGAVRAVAESLGLDLPWAARAADMSVAVLQKAEIVKTLCRGAKILILDEPTAALAPPEANALYSLLHNLTASGHTILVVTHRLQEVMTHAARVTVLRAGRRVIEIPTANTNVGELAALIVGGRASAPAALSSPDEDDAEAILTNVAYPVPPHETHRSDTVRLPVLEMREVAVPRDGAAPSPATFSLDVLAGEIVGVAGVDGSGQRELCEMIVGLRNAPCGRIFVNGRDVTSRPVSVRLAAGLAYCPEDRQRDGLILPFTLTENLLLGNLRQAELGAGALINWTKARRAATEMLSLYGIRSPSPDLPAASLSGGNQQKLMIARSLVRRPAILLAMQPTRGLDINATRQAFEAINAARAGGMGVLLISLDLDEILAVSDRIAVLYAGRIVGVLDREEADRTTIGAMMTTGKAAQ
jgi:simple sugar transport system ATP-binding protein